MRTFAPIRLTAFCGVVALSVFGGAAYGQNQADPAAFVCPVTPAEERLPVVAAMAGQYPVWMVDGSMGRWRGGDVPVKALWVVARDRAGPLVVTGRRLDGPGQAFFTTEAGASWSPVLVYSNVQEIKVLPGGASREIIDAYAFRTSRIIYPGPGCWEMTARLAEAVVQIVLDLEDRQ